MHLTYYTILRFRKDLKILGTKQKQKTIYLVEGDSHKNANPICKMRKLRLSDSLTLSPRTGHPYDWTYHARLGLLVLTLLLNSKGRVYNLYNFSDFHSTGYMAE